MLDLDLTLLREPKRFEQMCFRLARYEFPDVIPLAQSWDGGRDLVVFERVRGQNGDVVFQCKFVKDLIAAKRKIAKSLDALVKNGRHTAQWILCVPVEPSGTFMDWVNGELQSRGIAGSLWAPSELLVRLEQRRDVLETFFYFVFAERIPSGPMASMLALELSACFHPNALQKRYSARSPVGLFALRVMPRVRSWSATFACRASNCGAESSERFILTSPPASSSQGCCDSCL